MLPPLVRILLPAATAFIVGMALTPLLSHYLYKFKAWKKRAGKLALDGEQAHEFNRLHNHHEVRAPRMGGIVVWGSALLTILGIATLAQFFPQFEALNFLSRNQTWLPFATLIAGALSGFIGWWFFDKLDITAVNIPYGAPLEIGWLIIPLFIVVSLALYASGVIDGIDGLSGGVFASIFASYTIIAFSQDQIDLAAFTASVMGG